MPIEAVILIWGLSNKVISCSCYLKTIINLLSEPQILLRIGSCLAGDTWTSE